MNCVVSSKFPKSPIHTKPTVGYQAVFVGQPTKFSQCVPRRQAEVGPRHLFFRPIQHVESASELAKSVGPSDWPFSWRTSARERCRTYVLLGSWVSSVSLVCLGNFGPRRCRREPTPQFAFVATSFSVSGWCVPG